VGVFPAEAEPLVAGLSLSLALPARWLCCRAGGVLAWAGGGLAKEETERVEVFLVMPPETVVEVLRVVFFLDRVLVLPTVTPVPEPRLRFLMTSVFKLSGRTTPWSLRKRPHALQRGWPSGFRRQSGVVWVKQFVHVVGVLELSPWLPPAPCKLVVDPCLDPG
jgi:hypothetical protein